VAEGQGAAGTALLRKLASDLPRQGARTPSADTCGLLSATVLREAQAELTRLTVLVAKYADLLPERPGSVNASGRDTSSDLSGPEIVALVDGLQDASRNFTHIRGLATRVLSILITRVAFSESNADSQVSGWVEGVTRSSIDDILAGDYGRILKNKALIALYSPPDRPYAERLADAQHLFEGSVKLLPAASESWMNLAFIAFVGGDCAKAGDLADKAVDTAHKSARGHAEEFRKAMRDMQGTKRCADSAKDFAKTFAR